MNWSEFATFVFDRFFYFYKWTSSVYPFDDFPISLFWLLASVPLFIWLLSLIFPIDDGDEN